MINVLLVDDHPLVTERLEARLRQDPEIGIVETAATLAAARERLAAQPFDVVVCDVRLPDGSGLSLLAELDRQRTRPRFLMLSQHESSLYVQGAARRGARGYLLKSSPTELIVEAIHRVHAGGWVQDPDLAAGLDDDPSPPLTRREREVLEGLMRGMSNDEIGAGLGISRKTVEVHLARLFERARATSRTELAITVEREHWLDIPPER